jgi:hypothetical protein
MQRWQNCSMAINFNSREEYFSRPVKSKPLYLIDYKRYVKIVRPLPGEQDTIWIKDHRPFRQLPDLK